MIHRVKINQLLPDLTQRQLFTFRMAGEQQDAEDFGNRLRTRWMKANPGIATTMVTDWPTSQELGDRHVQPPYPDVNLPYSL